MSETLPPLPSPHDPAIQAALDADHLRLLEIGFYISSVMTALRFLWLLCMAAFFAIAGFATIFAKIQNAAPSPNGPPPAFIFFIIATIFGAILIFSLIFAALEFYAGVCLKNRRHPVLIQVIAGFYCLSIPWGTALGVFTFMVLNRPSVRPLFDSPYRGI